MKKSTLITTIAMVVVVVVALSTATYAWFTSSRQAVATTTITVQSSGNWTIQKGTVSESQGSEGTVTFSAAGDTITFDATLAGDVWAPKGTSAISAGPIDATSSDPSNAALGVKVGTVEWITAKQGTAVSGQTIWATREEELYPNVLRVLNTKTSNPSNGDPDQRALTLKVYVDLGSDPSEATKYAATCLSFYIEDGAGNVHTNGYNKPTTEITTTATAENVGKTAVATANPGAKVAETKTNSVTESKPTYNGAGNVGTALDNTTVETATGIAHGNYVYTYTVALGNVAYQQGINLAIFTWIDGYDITDLSIGSELNIVYSFE